MPYSSGQGNYPPKGDAKNASGASARAKGMSKGERIAGLILLTAFVLTGAMQMTLESWHRYGWVGEAITWALSLGLALPFFLVGRRGRRKNVR